MGLSSYRGSNYQPLKSGSAKICVLYSWHLISASSTEHSYLKTCVQVSCDFFAANRRQKLWGRNTRTICKVSFSYTHQAHPIFPSPCKLCSKFKIRILVMYSMHTHLTNTFIPPYSIITLVPFINHTPFGVVPTSLPC